MGGRVGPVSRLAILNGFGRTLGDGIIGLQALAVALRSGAIAGPPVLFRLPGLPSMIRQLYAAAADFISVAELPWADAEPGRMPEAARGFATVIDIRDFAFDPAFRETAMIDFFLRRLGVDPDAVPSAMKRNSWLAPRVNREPRAGGYVLVCPNASMDMRSMPVEIHDRIVAWLVRHQNRPVLSQTALPAETTLAGLGSLVASAALVISTDTAMVHLADAFSRPCLAFFPTHRPEWRVRDYPHCRAVRLSSGLPEALEFARDDADIERARAAWRPDGDAGWLDRVLAGTLERLDAGQDG